jgi:hypothetical protein
MKPDTCTELSLRAIFDAARRFELTDEEVWQTVDESLSAWDDAAVAKGLDDLAGALARRILSKQRRATPPGAGGVPHKGRRPAG